MSTDEALRRDVMANWNDTPDRPPFGTRDWWLQQPELAVTILMLWRDRQPAQFGGYLAEALTGAKPRGGRQ